VLLPDANETNVQAAGKILGTQALSEHQRTSAIEKKELEQKLAASEADPKYVNRESLAGPNGSLLQSLADAQAEQKNFETDRGKLNLPELEWLAKNPRPEGFFGALFDSLGGTNRQRKRYTVHVLATLKFSSLKAIDDRKRALDGCIASAKDAVKGVEVQIEDVRKATALRETLARDFALFDERSFEKLRKQCEAHLQTCNYFDVQAKIPQEHKPLVAKLALCRDKISLLGQLIESLGKEVADRENRIRSIENVRRKWQRSRKSYLKADKSAWLRNAPQQRTEVTHTYCNHYDTTYMNIMMFQNFMLYSMLLDRGHHYVPYVAMSQGAEAQAPNRFVQQALPETAKDMAEHPEAVKATQSVFHESEEFVEQDALNKTADELHEEAGVGAGMEREDSLESADPTDESADPAADNEVDAGDSVDDDLS
jgi:hypothetical protein